MPITVKSTGGGSVTLTAPSTASDLTLTLPSATGTVALTASPTFTGTVTFPGSGVWNSSGNVGINATPTSWGGGYNALQMNNTGRSLAATSSGSGDLTLAFNAIYDSADSRWEYAYTGDNAVRYSMTGAGIHAWYTAASGTGGNAITFTEAMRIDSSGNLLVGTTSATLTGGGVRLKNASGNLGEIALANNSGSADYVARFLWGSTPTLVGNITVSSTATAYNTSSDYRLKENVTPMTNGLAKISALKPVTYDWISDKSAGEGFIAHELAEVIPLAVTGAKNAVDDEGNIKPQSVDYSKIVVHLVAAIQELKADLDAAKAEIATLKGAA